MSAASAEVVIRGVQQMADPQKSTKMEGRRMAALEITPSFDKWDSI